ncbi:MAG TPA: iron uptake transporter deferrochelatase/peroxidase subunit [Trebonia sp.]|nr:iron uptake transporter deferrochelatase/peroxidase subunit [Trebonia sp.]
MKFARATEGVLPAAVASPSPSRRRLLTGAGLAGAGLVAGGLGGYAAGQPGATAAGPDQETTTVPFYGPHQAGIATPAQDRLAFGSLTVVDGATRADLRDVLAAWTQAAAKMTAGQLVGEAAEPDAPPVDTGEAVGSPVSRLTITVGYGPSLFDGRFGLAARKPAALASLPPLPNEDLDPDYTGGDLCLQACSDDPLVAFHAVRNLARIGMGVVEHNWLELGFGRTSTTSTSQQTPRNLLGFKDGTRNIKAEQTSLMNDYVWVGQETDQPWLRGGSYLVARKIRMFIENWDRDYLQDQENVIGRAKVSGAPLSGGSEFTAPDFAARPGGQPAIPVNAHIRLASYEHNGGTRILRRGYSYTDGIDPQAGTLVGGLFFIGFMKNPGQFIKLQNSLATDALNEYVHHVGSAVFACPPGVSPGRHWGDGLFSA